MEAGLENTKNTLKKLYDINIIPGKYRNIGCIYFIYDFFSTSNTPLNTVFFHMDLDKIQSQLGKMIANQEKSILQQAKIIAQNEEIIRQNDILFDELSNMSQNMDNRFNDIYNKLGSIHEIGVATSQWAEMGALNAEACACLEMTKYLNC